MLYINTEEETYIKLPLIYETQESPGKTTMKPFEEYSPPRMQSEMPVNKTPSEDHLKFKKY